MSLLQSKLCNDWSLFYLIVTLNEDRQIIDYVYVTLGGLAFLARVSEWTRIRLGKLRKEIR